MMAAHFPRKVFPTLTLLAGLLCMLAAGPVQAFQPAKSVADVNTDIQVFFTPGDDAAGNIIKAINDARQQVLVQAFSFTHSGIAQALIAAHKRGVEVRLIADLDQTRKIRQNKIADIAAAGVPVWLDGEHNGAHNKVMIIDADSADVAHVGIITGSYNFTNAAQHRNAENVLLIRANRSLAKAYQRNWQRHLPHARPFDASRLNTK
jgi:phosphatidylserine/phosphatidylglycerophosphate/cardiolipin synthase-like enzyme